MERRGFFGALAAIAAGTTIKAQPVRKYGCLTVDGHRAHKHLTGENLLVYVDGKEVRRCYEADDIQGYALAFCTDETEHRDWSQSGHVHVGGQGDACRFRLTGDVRIIPEVGEQ